MRFFTITVASMLATLVTSQGIPGLPSCAEPCVKYGSCGKLDIKCICSDKTLIAELSCCVSKKCSAAEQQTTIQFADKICKSAGITGLPTKASCAGVSSASSSSSSTSSTANAAATHGVFEGTGLGLVVAGLVAAL